MKRKESILNFIKLLLKISLPIILQSLFTNLAALIDTMMVGQIDDASISGVYIGTQIIFVINLCLFGSCEGAGVFFSQFLGAKDEEHLKSTFNFKIVFSIIAATICMLIIYVFGNNLVNRFTDSEQVASIALNYLRLVGTSLIPFAITISISTSMRESHSTVYPMIVTFGGILVNLLLNYVFIFGKWGAPALGSTGAAIGTIADRIFEMAALIIILFVKKYDFSQGFFHNFKFKDGLLRNLIVKSLPLMANELLWALGQTELIYIFTQKSGIATTVLPIVSTIYNLVFVVCLGLGNGVTILMGNIIGKSEFKEAQNKAYVSLMFALIVSILLGVILFIVSPYIVTLYKGVDQEAKEIATILLKFNSAYLIITTLNTTLFFLMRAGGRTFVVFLFDSAFGWLISIPVGFILLKFANLDLIQLYMCIYLLDIIKSIIGFSLIISKKWYKNLIGNYKKETI